MSKLEELIQELCPDGVEHKMLQEVCRFQNGFSFKSTLFKDEGEPILRITNIKEGKLSDDSYVYFDLEDYNENLNAYKVKKGDVVVAMSGATTGKIGYNYSNKEYYLNQRVGLFVPNENVLLKRFLYHWLTMQTKNIYNMSSGSGAQPNLSSIKMMKMVIPVPPLEVQCEIVRILDKFTLLTAELTAELTARRKQYEYYRNYILNNVEAEKKELSDVCDFLRGPFGSSLKKEYFKESGYVVYEQQHAIYQKLDFRYYIDADKFAELKRFEVNPGELIVSCSGTIGKVFVIPENAPKGIINQALLNLKPKDFIKAKYIKYFFENTLGEVLNNSARGGAIKNVPSVSELKKIKIHIPSKNEQQKIISFLDRFDKLCNDITNGLPAEIGARQKQYEYYRDKLLTFKEKK